MYAFFASSCNKNCNLQSNLMETWLKIQKFLSLFREEILKATWKKYSSNETSVKQTIPMIAFHWMVLVTFNFDTPRKSYLKQKWWILTWLISPKEFQAFHFAFPTKSNAPGFSALHFPTVLWNVEKQTLGKTKDYLHEITKRAEIAWGFSHMTGK